MIFKTRTPPSEWCSKRQAPPRDHGQRTVFFPSLPRPPLSRVPVPLSHSGHYVTLFPECDSWQPLFSAGRGLLLIQACTLEGRRGLMCLPSDGPQLPFSHLCSPETPWPFKVMTHAVGELQGPLIQDIWLFPGSAFLFRTVASQPGISEVSNKPPPRGLGAPLPLVPPSPAPATLQNSWEREGRTPAAVSEIPIGVGSGAGSTQPGCRAGDHLRPACHPRTGRLTCPEATLRPALVWEHRASLSALCASDPRWGNVL